jgi:hypothetical protein
MHDMAPAKGAAHCQSCTGARDAFQSSKGNLHKTNRLLIVLGITLGCLTLRAGDDRFGFATHFEQGWPTNPDMRDIAAAGVSYIRDDLNAGNWEPSLGAYVLPASDMAWLTAAQANGLQTITTPPRCPIWRPGLPRQVW